MSNDKVRPTCYYMSTRASQTYMNFSISFLYLASYYTHKSNMAPYRSLILLLACLCQVQALLQAAYPTLAGRTTMMVSRRRDSTELRDQFQGEGGYTNISQDEQPQPTGFSLPVYDDHLWTSSSSIEESSGGFVKAFTKEIASNLGLSLLASLCLPKLKFSPLALTIAITFVKRNLKMEHTSSWYS